MQSKNNENTTLTGINTSGQTVGQAVATVIGDNAVLYFDIITEHAISIQNQITDNWVENNTAIHDHIAQSPLVINLSGISGEKVFTPSSQQYNELLQEAKKQNNKNQLLTNKLSAISSLLPSVDNYTQIAKNAFDYASASVNRYTNIVKQFLDPKFNSNNPMDTFNGIKSEEKETRLQQIYKDLNERRTASFIVATPYATFNNMYLQSVTLRQGNENYVTDLELSFKQIGFADVTTTKADQEVMEKYNAYARAQEQNEGKAQGVKKDVSILLQKARNVKNSFTKIKWGK